MSEESIKCIRCSPCFMCGHDQSEEIDILQIHNAALREAALAAAERLEIMHSDDPLFYFDCGEIAVKLRAALEKCDE